MLVIAAERQRGSTLFLTLHEVLAFSCPVPGRVIYSRNLDFAQSRSQSPRSSVGGIVGLWENPEENQPLIGCLITNLTHSLLIEMRAILIIQEAKYKLVYLTWLFIALLTLRLHNTEQCIHKHNTNYTIEKYMQRNYTMQITCKHSAICS